MKLLPLVCCAAGLLAPAPGRATEPVKNPALRDELLAREKADQKARLDAEAFLAQHGQALGRKSPRVSSDDLPPELREEFMRLVARTLAIDRENRAWLAKVLDRHGWPGRTLVGPDAADSAWLLAQHAEPDRAFQRRCLHLMRTMPKGEVDPGRVAALERRYEEGVKREPGR